MALIDLDAVPFIKARWYKPIPGGRQQFAYVVIHDMEFYERPDSAEWCANFFATSDRVGSTHMCVDSDSIVRCVADGDVCYGANGVNHNGLHIEHAGFAGQTAAEWTDEYSIAMLWLSARLTATWCKRYDIPIRFVDSVGLLRGERGITTHREAEIAFPYHGHTDPGPNFPVTMYINMVLACSYEKDDMTPQELGLIRNPENPQDPRWGQMLLETYIPAVHDANGTLIQPEYRSWKWYAFAEATTYIHQELKEARIRDST